MSHPPSPLFAQERKEKIIELLERQEKVLVPALCEQFHVSSVTIRSDLRELEAEGRLRRTHGGAIRMRKTSFEPGTQEKSVVHIEEKRRIAIRAAQMVENGDTIALDTGTTIMELCRALVHKRKLTVVTNDLQVALFAEENIAESKVILAGGELRYGQHCTVGSIALQSLQGLHADCAFMATNAFHLQHGFTTPSIEQAQIKRRLLELADTRVMLADMSKAGGASFAKFASIDEVDTLITGRDLASNMVKALEELIEVVLV